MINEKINPFDPNNPCEPNIFAGRTSEIQLINQLFLQTKVNKGHGFLLLGQRGIGKTSFLNYIKQKAIGIIIETGHKFNFLVIDVSISKEIDQLQLIKKINLLLKRKLANTERTRALFENIWNFIGRIEILGNKIDTSKEIDKELLFDEFCYSLSETIKRIKKAKNDSEFESNYDGLIIIIDECDTASDSLDIGTFSKLLYETLQKEDTKQFILGLVGLPKTKQILYKSHESSIRIFDEINLDRFLPEEIVEIIDKVLIHSKSLNGFETSIEPAAVEYIISFSEGFPHFIHQYGYCAFECSNGELITAEDVIEGAFRKNGAIERIGKKYYENDFYNKLKDDNSRKVLSIMAKEIDSWINFKDIKSQFQGEETTLIEALNALLINSLIIKEESLTENYRLIDKGFAWWIVMNEKKKERIDKQIAEHKQNLKDIINSSFFKTDD